MATIDTQTHNVIPQPGRDNLDELQVFLANEDANRFDDNFGDYIIQGGVLEPQVGLFGTPTPITAYISGFFVFEDSEIKFTFQKETWIALHIDKTTTDFEDEWERVTGTYYLKNDGSQFTPPLPPDAIMLFSAITVANINGVTDLRDVPQITGLNSISFTWDGNAQLNTSIVDGFSFRAKATIDRMFIHAKTLPSGGDLTIILRKNDIEVATGILTDGSESEITFFDPVEFSHFDGIGLQFTAVDPVPAADIDVALYYTEAVQLQPVIDGLRDISVFEELAYMASHRAYQAIEAQRRVRKLELQAKQAADNAKAFTFNQTPQLRPPSGFARAAKKSLALIEEEVANFEGLDIIQVSIFS